MSQPTDELMERLQQANPVPPDGALSAGERRHGDALLERVLAEPAPARPAPRRPLGTRRIALAGACVAVLGLALVAALDLLESGDSAGGIVDRAVAAVSDENAIYAVTERSSSTLTPLGGGEVERERSFRRYWLWKAGERSRFVDYRARPDGGRGRLLSDIAFDRDRMYWYEADANRLDIVKRSGARENPSATDSEYPGFDPFSDPGAQLRDHVAEGRLRVAGKTTVRGRTAYRLVSEPISNPGSGVSEETVSYLVDARSYLPMRVRAHGRFEEPGGDPDAGRFEYDMRADYLSYEALPDTPANRAKLRVGSYPGVERRRSTAEMIEPAPPLEQQEID